ncbi:MAG: CRISPR-associated endonuclease Cas1 [bacterium]|nr:CRISPR-associated endonuclease Cas1 [bacterium]
MPTLYLLEQGTKLNKTSKRLVVEKEREIIAEIPEFKVERVFVFGNVQISTQALRFLLEHQIDLSYFTMQGKCLGKLISFESKNVLVRMAQYAAAKDEEFKLRIAKSLVAGKIRNCLTLVQRFARNHPEIPFAEEITRLQELHASVERKTQISSLLGVEGVASQIYFKAFGKMLVKDFTFTERNRHPPRDPVNSLLSLGYTLLTAEMSSLLFGLGVDPYVGFLHQIEYSRPSLALDLIEEFRSAIVDRFVLDLIHKDMLQPTDFTFEQTEDGEVLRVLLAPEAKRVFFTQYEKRLATEITVDDTMMSYRRLFEHQARKMITAIEQRTDYVPFSYR